MTLSKNLNDSDNPSLEAFTISDPLFFYEEGIEEPVYSTKHSACFDIAAKHPFTLESGKVSFIKTGIRINPSCSFWNQFHLKIYSRSGFSTKNKVILANGIGVIDSDYPEEIMVPLLYLGEGTLSFPEKTRIAQGEFCLNVRLVTNSVHLIKTKDVSRTSGFGSTGL